LLRGVIDKSDGSFSHARACLPKRSCLNLTISVPETCNKTGNILGDNNDTFDYTDHGELRLAFDNVIYRDRDSGRLHLGKDYDSNDDYALRETTFFGDCNNPNICGSDNKSLLDVTFYVPEDDQDQLDCDFFSRIHCPDGMVAHTDDLKAFDDYWHYTPDTLYRTIQCIPADKCEMVACDYSRQNSSVKYSIAVNGKTIKDRHIDQKRSYGQCFVTALDVADSSTHKHSNGAIAAIVIGSVAAVVAFVRYKVSQFAAADPNPQVVSPYLEMGCSLMTEAIEPAKLD